MLKNLIHKCVHCFAWKNCTIVGHFRVSKPWLLLVIWKDIYNIYLWYYSCIKMEKSMPRKWTQEWDFLSMAHIKK